ncbi:hypothetical protein Tco_0873723 [Tanacetum coccineum]|uniref:Uncharacterized protein n=1 Tax=Tanacetum coccineum TaxID=301880 RepID=A0ABQ5BMH4_9ASTR
MSTYLKNMVGYKNNQLKNKSFDDIQELFDKAMKRVNTFVDMETELVEGSEHHLVLNEVQYKRKTFGERNSEEECQVSGRIVRIKRLLNDLGVTTAKVCVTAAK